MTKKFASLMTLTLLAATFNGYGMKRILEIDPQTKPVFAQAQLPTGEWVDIVGLILNQNAPMRLLLENFYFKELPEDVQAHIIQLLSLSTTATTLQEAAYTIKSLSLTDKRLNELINNPHFCLQLIKNLAHRFKCSDFQAATTLNTPEAQQRLLLQKLFLNAVDQNNSDMVIQSHNAGADFNFTYPIKGLHKAFPGRTEIATFLMLAIKQNNCPMIKILLNYGADINIVTSVDSALEFASYNGNIDTMQCLLSNLTMPINFQARSFYNSLDWAIHYGNFPMVELLYNYFNTYINKTDKYENNLLITASRNSYSDTGIEILSYLLTKTKLNMDINEQNEEGTTPLILVIKSFNDLPSVQLLLNNGADVNKADNEGKTALMHSVSPEEYGLDIEIVKYLLTNPTIAINQKDKRGNTALMTALNTNYDDSYEDVEMKTVIELLLDAGADPEIANNDGLTPLQAAQETEDQEVINLIQEAIGKKNEKK